MTKTMVAGRKKSPRKTRPNPHFSKQAQQNNTHKKNSQTSKLSVNSPTQNLDCPSKHPETPLPLPPVHIYTPHPFNYYLSNGLGVSMAFFHPINQFLSGSKNPCLFVFSLVASRELAVCGLGFVFSYGLRVQIQALPPS